VTVIADAASTVEGGQRVCECMSACEQCELYEETQELHVNSNASEHSDRCT